MRVPFKFKQFSLDDGRSAMKLSTDAVLLGVFAGVDHAREILDVGTGSGIIALMLAQRCDARITGIDIDEGSIRDAGLNFSISPWRERLEAVHRDLDEFVSENPGKFDHVVCNPPFFMNSMRSPFHERNLSKHGTALTFKGLIPSVRRALHEKGVCSFIIPAGEEAAFHQLAVRNDLYLLRKKRVFPKKSKDSNRVLLEYSLREKEEPNVSDLTIRNADNSFTDEYKNYTKDFYLDF